MKRVLALILAGLLCSQSAFAAELQTEPEPVPQPMYVERAELYSTKINAIGSRVRFVNITDEALQNSLNRSIEAFYDEVFAEALGDGNPPFPPVDLDTKILTGGPTFELTITASISYPDSTRSRLYQIVLDDKGSILVSESRSETDVIRLSSADDRFFMEGNVAMVPFRDVCEFFGFVVGWNGTSAHVDTGMETFTVTPGVNGYDGKTLELPPVNKNGSLHVPLSFYEDVMGMWAAVTDDGVVIENTIYAETGLSQASASASSSASAGMVYGSVFDATMNSFTIIMSDGNKISFPTQDNTDKSGLELDALVTVAWTCDGIVADLAKADMSKLLVASVKSASKTEGAVTYIGKVTDATMNTVTIETVSGRTVSFSLNDETDLTNSGGRAVGSAVAVEFMGEVKGEDASGVTVLSVTMID